MRNANAIGAIVGTVCLTFVTGAGWCTEPLNQLANRRYPASPVKSPPVIDGKFDDAGWKRIPEATYFQTPHQRTDSVTRQTGFRIGYDAEFLYFGARCNEPLMPQVSAHDRTQDGWPKVDSVVLLLSRTYDPDGDWQDSPYVMLEFGAGGIHQCHRDVDKKHVPVDAPTAWLTAYATDARHWYVESRIPLAMADIEAQGEVFFNVSRHLLTGPNTEAISTWEPYVNDSLGRHSFARLQFRDRITPGTSYRINIVPNYAFNTTWLVPLARKTGHYALAKSKYGDHPAWVEAEAVADRMASFTVPGKDVRLDMRRDDAFIEWLQVLDRLDKSAVPMPISMHERDAHVREVLMNGSVVEPADDGSYRLQLLEGVNTLLVRAEAAGPNPGLKIDLRGHPETANAFRVSPVAAVGCERQEFDDATWPMAIVRDGYLWGDDAAASLVLRQNVLWGRHYHGTQIAFIGPPVTEWGISPGSTETFRHWVFNPLKETVREHVMELEIPEGFRMLDNNPYAHPSQRPAGDGTPDTQTVDRITVNGIPYLRYRMVTDIARLKGNTSRGLFIAIKHESYPFAGGQPAVFRFRRNLDGNSVDLDNVIAVKPLPPVRGGKMKHIEFSQYHMGLGVRFTEERLRALLDDACRAGMDNFMSRYNSRAALAKPSDRSRKVDGLNAEFKARGVRNMVWVDHAMPLWGTRAGRLRDLRDSLPGLKSSYFAGEEKANLSTFMGQMCLTLATGECREQVLAALIEDYRFIHEQTGCKVFFMNDEHYARMNHGASRGWNNAYCFCDHCKEAFRAYTQLPADADLSDNTRLIETYEKEWTRWWKHMHKNRLLGIAKQAADAVGVDLHYYHNTHDRVAYEESLGLYSRVSVPVPGTNRRAVDSRTQANIDAVATRIRAMGIPRFMGQQRSYCPFGLNKSSVSSYDTYHVDPPGMKSQMVRIAASTRLGSMFECVSLFAGGMLYYAGEATRLIAAYEGLFWEGERDESLADAGEHGYPNMLVLTKGDERLVLLFNEDRNEEHVVQLRNLELKPGQNATLWERPEVIANPAEMQVAVPPNDVVAVHIRRPPR